MKAVMNMPLIRRAAHGRKRAARLRDEAGNASVLLIGYLLVVMLLLAAVTAITGAYLQRNSLQGYADGVALAAAKSVSDTRVYGGNAALLGGEAATWQAKAYSQQEVVLRGGISGVSVSPAVLTPDARGVSVRVSADIAPPLTGWFLHATGLSWRIEVVGRAYR
ncbi:pilus assembly protein TadG-related protein [Dermabacteraceae bacterium P13077]